MKASTTHYFSAANATRPGPGSSYHQYIPTMIDYTLKHEPEKKIFLPKVTFVRVCYPSNRESSLRQAMFWDYTFR